MVKTDWDLRHQADGRLVLTRYRTPISLWVLDRWFRVPDLIFGRIEAWFPRTTRVTRIPCLLYARWTPELITHR
jgi:hypothetical protein